MPKKIKFAIILIILNLSILLTALILLEIRFENNNLRQGAEKCKQIRPWYWWSFYTSDGVRVGKTFGPLKLMIHPFLSYKNMPNQKEKNFSVNSLGFRGKEISKNTKDKKRIIIIGGSSAFGTGLNSDKETCACQLEQILNVEVINAGVIGYLSNQELIYLFMELVDLKPDLVIALNGFNDYLQSLIPTNKVLIGCNGQDQIESKLKLLSLLIYTSLMERIAGIKYILFPEITSRIDTFTSKRIKNIDKTVDIDIAARVYANNMIKVQRVSNIYKFNFICLIQPKKVTSDTKKGVDVYQVFRNRVKKYFSNEGIRYIDLNDDNFKNVFTEDRFMDEMHLDEEGNGRLAEIIAKTIIGENLL